MTTAAARAQLQGALTAAVPLAAVYPMPPASIAGPSVIIAPDGWAVNNGAWVEYRVSVSLVTNKPDTTQALEDLESMAAAAWLATFAAGWSPGDMSAPSEVTYADQPYLAMTYSARRLATL